MSDSLLPKRFLFRVAMPCRYRDPLWTEAGVDLDESHRLANLAQLEGQTALADVRAAWSEAGLVFWIDVAGKKQAVWCRESRLQESDGLQVWIDTRDVHNVHRAGRFCHRFVFLPGGRGSKHEKPIAEWLPIHRAREHPKALRPEHLQVIGKRRRGGYRLQAFIAAEALTGFDPQDHPRLGFTYAVLDRELGQQTLSVGQPMPYEDDTSMWATLELVGGES